MNDLFATWHHSRPGVLEQLLQARRELAREPALEAAWVMVDTAITQVSLWLEQQNGPTPAIPARGSADAQRLLRPVPPPRFEGDAARSISGHLG
ncbi:MAG: hypothetical protein ACRD0O_03720 [Acidimicrobiia bacterium]